MADEAIILAVLLGLSMAAVIGAWMVHIHSKRRQIKAAIERRNHPARP